MLAENALEGETIPFRRDLGGFVVVMAFPLVATVTQILENMFRHQVMGLGGKR